MAEVMDTTPTDQMSNLTAAEMRHFGRVRGAISALATVMGLASIVYFLVYVDTLEPKVLQVCFITIAAMLPLGLAHMLLQRGRRYIASYLIMAAPAIVYGLTIVNWSGRDPFVVVGGVLLVGLTGQLVLPDRWPLWLVFTVLFALHFMSVIGTSDASGRYDISQNDVLNVFVPAFTLLLIMIMIWRIFRALQSSTIRVRLTFGFVAIVSVPLLIVMITSALVSREGTIRQVTSQLESIVKLKRSAIETWINFLETDLGNLVANDETRQRVNALVVGSPLPAGVQFAYEAIDEQFSQAVNNGRFTVLSLVDIEGNIVYSTDKAREGGSVLTSEYFSEGLEDFYINPPEIINNTVEITFARPIHDPQTLEPVGVLAGVADLDNLNAITAESAGLGDTGETILVGDDYALLTASRFDYDDWQSGEGIRVETEATVNAIANRTTGSGVYRDYRDQTVIGVYDWIADLEMVLVAKQDQSEALSPLTFNTVINTGVVLIAAFVAITASLWIARGIANPIGRLAETASQIAAGHTDLVAEVEQEDETGELAHAFNAMTGRLHDLIENLEQRVSERTHELEVTAELGRLVTGMRDLESLLPYAVNLIQQRTNFYHVQIFLIDEAREFAVLRASTGDVGRQLLEAGHRLAIGSASVIGQVAERGQPVIAHDTEDSSTIHRKNPVLPDTRAEMALPLRVGARIIGALDVQSRQPGVFQDNDVRMFGLLADQLAVAIDNAQLFQESNERLQEINELNQQLVGRAWRDYLQQRGDQAVGVVAGMHDNVALDTTLTADMAQALSREDVVTRRSGEGAVIALPVRLGEASIGALEFEVEAESIDPETLELAQALADRLALTLENARLFEQAQRLGQRESVVNQVSSTLTGITDMDELLQTAVRELGRALRIPETTIRLMDIRAPAAAPNGGDGQSAPPEHPGGVDADLQEG